MGRCGAQRGLWGHCGSRYGLLWVTVGHRGIYGVSVGLSGAQWVYGVPLGRYGALWGTERFMGSLWVSLWVAMGVAVGRCGPRGRFLPGAIAVQRCRSPTGDPRKPPRIRSGGERSPTTTRLRWGEGFRGNRPTAFCCLYFIYVIGIVSEKAEGYVYGTYCYLCFFRHYANNIDEI